MLRGETAFVYNLFAVIMAFLIGSIPTGYLIGKCVYGVDVRLHGSRNLGATNVMRVLGKTPGIVCLVLDILKGAIPVILLSRGEVSTQVFVAFGAVAGHCFSPWMGWRGGKGVATAVGVLAAIAPWQVMWTVLICVMLIAATSYVSVGSLVGAVLFPTLVFFSDCPELIFYLSIVLGTILIARHKTNLQRLFAGVEKPFWGQKKIEGINDDEAKAVGPDHSDSGFVDFEDLDESHAAPQAENQDNVTEETEQKDVDSSDENTAQAAEEDKQKPTQKRKGRRNVTKRTEA